MPFEARYVVSTSASSLHAAAAMLSGEKLVEKNVADALAEDVAGLADDLAAGGLARELFFEHASPLAVRFDAPRAWADVLVTKTLGPRRTGDALAARLAMRLTMLEAAFQRAIPRALEELELRSEPLRDQWDARGPGLLSILARLSADDLVVAGADVILVQPVLGGGGQAHPKYNSVSIEAVLANPLAELPEMVRLGWLVAQLNLDLPKYEEVVPRDRLLAIGPLAMIPPVLAAAEEVELMRFDEATLSTALAAWRAPAAEPKRLMEWWETCRTSDVPWTVALGALERMLCDETA